MTKNTERLWYDEHSGEQIAFIFGYYKLISKYEMIPLGKTIDEVKEKLKLFGRDDILRTLRN